MVFIKTEHGIYQKRKQEKWELSKVNAEKQ